MKKFKISLIAVLAVIMGIAGSAFTVKQAVKKTDTFYFRYIPDNRNAGLQTPSNWESVEGPTSVCSNTSGVNCVMHLDVEPVDGKPDFSTAGITSDSQIDALTDTFKDEE